MTFQAFKTANLARGKMEAWVSPSSNTLILQDGQWDLFPNVFPYLLNYVKYDNTSTLEIKPVLKREIVKVTNKSWDTFTVVRSYWYCPANDEATTQTNTAFSFDAWDSVFLADVSELYDDLITEVERLEAEKLNTSDYQNGIKTYASTSTGTDSYEITLDPPIASYLVGQTFRFQADVGNTWTATLNVNGLGAKTIKKQHDQHLWTWDIEAWQIVTVAYDWTNFQMDSQVATIPSVDINGEIEDTTWDIDADFIHEYDTSAWGNRKIKPSKWRASNADALALWTTKFLSPVHLLYAWSAPTAWTSVMVAKYLTELWQIGNTYVKKFEGTILKTWTYTISFELKRQNGGSWGLTNARVYKNWVAFGTNQTESSTSFTAPKVENLAFNAGDVVSLYLHWWQASAYGYVRNFMVTCDQLQFTLA